MFPPPKKHIISLSPTSPISVYCGNQTQSTFIWTKYWISNH